MVKGGNRRDCFLSAGLKVDGPSYSGLATLSYDVNKLFARRPFHKQSSVFVELEANVSFYLAFRDRGAGVDRNRTRTTDDGTRGSSRGGGYGARVRGGKL